MRKCRWCTVELPSIKLSSPIEKAGFCQFDCKTAHERAKAKRTKPKKAKVKTIAQELDAAAVLCQRMVRLKAADDDGMCVCWSCGKPGHWSEMQGGHFIERKKTATKADEANIHPQHSNCNLWEMKKASTVLDYRRKMVDYYGEAFVNDLIARSKQTFKPSREWIAEQVQYFKEQIAFHEKRLGVSK